MTRADQRFDERRVRWSEVEILVCYAMERSSTDVRIYKTRNRDVARADFDLYALDFFGLSDQQMVVWFDVSIFRRIGTLLHLLGACSEEELARANEGLPPLPEVPAAWFRSEEGRVMMREIQSSLEACRRASLALATPRTLYRCTRDSYERVLVSTNGRAVVEERGELGADAVRSSRRCDSTADAKRVCDARRAELEAEGFRTYAEAELRPFTVTWKERADGPAPMQRRHEMEDWLHREFLRLGIGEVLGGSYNFESGHASVDAWIVPLKQAEALAREAVKACARRLGINLDARAG